MAENGETIFYMGLIDVLIPWPIKRRIEYIWRTIQGYKKEASCNPLWDYCDRQTEWFDKYW